jgi:hypothetical protein
VPAAIGGAAAVVAGVVAFGLANNDDDEATRAPAGLSLDDVEPALLTEDDVGAGFAESTPGGDGELRTDDMDTSPECRQVLRSFEQSDDEGEDLEADFEDTDGATLSHTLALIDEDEPTMDEALDALGECRTIGWDDGETQGEIRLSADDIDGPGDQAFEMEMEIEGSSQGVTVVLDGYVVYSMREGVVSTVGGFGAIDPDTLEGEPVDRDLVRSLAERADEKVHEALEG